MKKLSMISAVIVIVFTAFVLPDGSFEMRADPNRADGDESYIGSAVDELLNELDLASIQGLLNKLQAEQITVFGFDDIISRVRAVATGEYKDDFGGVVSYITSLLGADVLAFMPMLIACVAIALAYNIIAAMRGGRNSEAIERVVFFAVTTLAAAVVIGCFAAVLKSAVDFVTSVKTQITAIAPVLLTLMTATGAAATAGVYSPAVAALGTGMTNAVVYLAFPALLMGIVFDIIGCISPNMRLDKTAEFFRSACKWVLGAAFFLFAAVIGVSGITASVRDGITVRAARFALSKYVPVIGGYLSQGFDFVMAGNVLIKNALGSSAVILMVLLASPVLCKLAVFTLTLKLTAAIVEPIGGEKLCGMLGSVAKSASATAAIAAAMTFLYILFLTMLICTGNIGL